MQGKDKGLNPQGHNEQVTTSIGSFEDAFFWAISFHLKTLIVLKVVNSPIVKHKQLLKHIAARFTPPSTMSSA